MRDEEYSAAYFVPRKTSTRKSKRRRRSHRAAGLLITVLLLLTAAICLLVFFLPRLPKAVTSSSSHAFGGKTYFALAVGNTTTRQEALTFAEYAQERGGAGYIYNDGEYKIIAALYEREVDAKTLVSVNQNSFYFSLSVPSCDCEDGDKAALEYLTGEWFSTVNAAATELDRGNITEAAAELALDTANGKLKTLAHNAQNSRLKSALLAITERALDGFRVLSGIRYIQVFAIVTAGEALV
ncbi:MAG: hypothetical protein HDT28_05710 [Clostridiales bacterium]|nr:hypothetical protein [Clostridiales bacterium]